MRIFIINWEQLIEPVLTNFGFSHEISMRVADVLHFITFLFLMVFTVLCVIMICTVVLKAFRKIKEKTVPGNTRSNRQKQRVKLRNQLSFEDKFEELFAQS